MGCGRHCFLVILGLAFLAFIVLLILRYMGKLKLHFRRRSRRADRFGAAENYRMPRQNFGVAHHSGGLPHYPGTWPMDAERQYLDDRGLPSFRIAPGLLTKRPETFDDLLSLRAKIQELGITL